ncbi:MAG: ribose-phosphate pyrophosphokinase-like domain-containing protein [Rhizobiaceae bacterium]
MFLFSLSDNHYLAELVAAGLAIPLSSHEERNFEDGEFSARTLIGVRGEDVYALQSLHGGTDRSTNDKICRLAFFAVTLKENGARRVTAVVPYLAYARKHRQTKTRDPVRTRYLALLL